MKTTLDYGIVFNDYNTEIKHKPQSQYDNITYSSSYFKLEEGKYNRYVDKITNMVRYRDILLFDQFGKKVGAIEITDPYKEYEYQYRDKLYNSTALIQIDYKFYVMDVRERLSIIEGRDKLAWDIKKITNKEHRDRHLVMFYNNKYSIYSHRNGYQNEYKKCGDYEITNAKAIEVNNTCGVSYEFSEDGVGDFLSVSITDYISEKESALFKFPDYKEEIELLFKDNITQLAFYFMTTPDQFIKPSFDRVAHLNKRLQLDINKQKQEV